MNKEGQMMPKYLEISKEIIKSVESGKLLPGDKVPSENELINLYKISNTTARKVLSELETDGWVVRIRGKGTFVLNRTQDHQLVRPIGSIHATRRGFHEYLTSEGYKHKDILLEKIVLDSGVSVEINKRHYIINKPVIKIHLLRYADEELMKDEVKYISLALCPKIDRLPTKVSYFKYYEDKYNLEIGAIRQTFSSEIFDQSTEENNFINDHPIPIFVLDSVVTTKNNLVIEIEKSYYRGDKYKFSFSADL